MILESHLSLRMAYGAYFQIFEIVSIVIFSAEYLYRIGHAIYLNGSTGAFQYIFSFFGLIDLISILPFYLNQFIKLDGRFLRILRLFRLTRIFKFGRKSNSLKVFTKALFSVKSELIFTLFLSIITILFFCIGHLLFRIRGTTREIFKYYGIHLVGNGFISNGRLWRCIPYYRWWKSFCLNHILGGYCSCGHSNWGNQCRICRGNLQSAYQTQTINHS